jgi:Ca2+-transporting ATPase
MKTGDHKETAIAIAKDLHILTDTESNQVLTGAALDALSDEELVKKIGNVAVFARTNPEQKIKIVQAWQTKGDIVAMTGDGVNDAPAIARANVGVAMGITGTQATKETADMVISDDNFASIVQAIAVGRGILDNIIKFVHYLICHNIAELIIIFFAILFNVTDAHGNRFLGLLPIQLLWLNLVTDGILAIALAFDPASSTVMQRPPRDPDKPLITYKTAIKLSFFAFCIATTTFAASYVGLRQNNTVGYSYTLTCIILMAIGLVNAIRKESGLPLFSNKWLWLAFFASIGLQLLLLYTPMRIVFMVAPLTPFDWGLLLTITSIGLLSIWLFQLTFKLR